MVIYWPFLKLQYLRFMRLILRHKKGQWLSPLPALSANSLSVACRKGLAPGANISIIGVGVLEEI
jgi:hypothetical protein